MIINFSEHSESEIRFAHCYEPGEIDLDDEDARIAGALEVSGAARRSSGIARVAGNLRGQLEIACSRCLQLIETKLDSAFAVEFVTTENYTAASEVELGETDLALSIYDGDSIDIDEIVREQVLLDLPARQLCRDDCRGFCQKCGANQNLAACSCETTEVDPRWQALEQLRNKN